MVRWLAGPTVVVWATTALAQTATVRVDAAHPRGPVSRYLTGACLEDVNHEVYGGLYSQMLFGESFQEPATPWPVAGFAAYGGQWTAHDGQVDGDAGLGPKLVADRPPVAAGTVGVDVLLPGPDAGNAGLVVGVAHAGEGADAFDGYEVSLDAAAHRLRLGRHRHDYRLVAEVPCDVVPDRWASLSVTLTPTAVDVAVDGRPVLHRDDPDRPTAAGTFGLRLWQRPARYRHLFVATPDGRRTDVPLAATPAAVTVSGAWTPVASGSAVLAADGSADRPFVGGQSQRLTFVRGTGEAGIANRGLNGRGLSVVAGRSYDGCLWLRGGGDGSVSLESRDGTRRYAAARLAPGAADWRRADFALTPAETDADAQFAVRLTSPGTVTVGYAFLQPGEWGRYHGLPVRRDVVDALVDQGVTLLRYGGSMVNAAGYRWKDTVGPRDRRPPYRGTWYPYASNGWGMGDFLDLCDAAGILPVPDLNADESPADVADLLDYANGPADGPWGRRRVSDGHPKPYGLTHLEIGNEERVDDDYYAKFAGIAAAVWGRDPRVVLVVGDFEYADPITDPDHLTGATSGIPSMDAHRKVLALAKRYGAEVWFDVHVWTDRPPASRPLDVLPTYVDAIDRLAGGARHRVVVFELNANHHGQGRAVANAQAIVRAERDGRLPVVCSANCLQPDGQNDNGWDQGLLFLNPEKVWLQPPGYVARMISRGYQPVRLDCTATGGLEAAAAGSDDGKTVVVQVVNVTAEAVTADVQLDGFTRTRPTVAVEQLSASGNAANTAAEPARVVPVASDEPAGPHRFPPRSFTVLRFR